MLLGANSPSLALLLCQLAGCEQIFLQNPCGLDSVEVHPC